MWQIFCTTESGFKQLLTLGDDSLENAVDTMDYLRQCNPTKQFRLITDKDLRNYYRNLVDEL
jgi:hypothetical protein